MINRRCPATHSLSPDPVNADDANAVCEVKAKR